MIFEGRGMEEAGLQYIYTHHERTDKKLRFRIVATAL